MSDGVFELLPFAMAFGLPVATQFRFRSVPLVVFIPGVRTVRAAELIPWGVVVVTFSASAVARLVVASEITVVLRHVSQVLYTDIGFAYRIPNILRSYVHVFVEDNLLNDSRLLGYYGLPSSLRKLDRTLTKSSEVGFGRRTINRSPLHADVFFPQAHLLLYRLLPHFAVDAHSSKTGGSFPYVEAFFDNGYYPLAAVSVCTIAELASGACCAVDLASTVIVKNLGCAIRKLLVRLHRKQGAATLYTFRIDTSVLLWDTRSRESASEPAGRCAHTRSRESSRKRTCSYDGTESGNRDRSQAGRQAESASRRGTSTGTAGCTFPYLTGSAGCFCVSARFVARNQTYAAT